jgi:hypothetical protein
MTTTVAVKRLNAGESCRETAKLTKQSKLLIDFQFQRMSTANAKFNGQRIP